MFSIDKILQLYRIIISDRQNGCENGCALYVLQNNILTSLNLLENRYQWNIIRYLSEVDMKFYFIILHISKDDLYIENFNQKPFTLDSKPLFIHFPLEINSLFISF